MGYRGLITFAARNAARNAAKLTAGLAVLGLLVAVAAPRPAAHHLDGVGCIDNGCWIDIYDFPDFDSTENHIRLCGPAEIRQLVNIDGVDWSNDIKSFVIGHTARVRLYEDQDFDSLIESYGPRARIYNLGGHGDDVESIQIECRPPTPRDTDR